MKTIKITLSTILLTMMFISCENLFNKEDPEPVNYAFIIEQVTKKIDYDKLSAQVSNDLHYGVLATEFYNDWKRDTIARQIEADRMTWNIIQGLYYDSLASYLSDFMYFKYDSLAWYILQQTDSTGKVQVNVSLYHRYDTLIRICEISNNPIILNYDIDKEKVDSIINIIIK